MKRTRFLLSISLSSILFLSSCNLPLSQGDANKLTTPDFLFALPEITATTQPTVIPPPVCPDASAFGRIYSNWPNLFKIMSTTPEFTWFYGSANGNPGSVEAWAYECVPESYILYLSTGPDFEDEIIVPVSNASVVADSTKLTMKWTLTTPLEPLKVYRWAVVGHANGMTLEDWKIADIHDDAIWPPINTVNMTYTRTTFRTGPECAVGQIPVPTLTTPINGDVIQTLNPILVWEVSSCMPLVFWLQISTQPTFENPEDYVDPSLPGDYTRQSQRNYPYAFIDYTLRDCTRFYWHVRGGGIPGSQDWGNYSDEGMFTVNLGQCPTPTPIYVPPASTPTPTSVPPIVCAGLNMTDCNNNSSQCKWTFPITHAGPGYCVQK